MNAGNRIITFNANIYFYGDCFLNQPNIPLVCLCSPIAIVERWVSLDTIDGQITKKKYRKVRIVTEMAGITIFNLSPLVIVYIRDFPGQIHYFVLLAVNQTGSLKFRDSQYVTTPGLFCLKDTALVALTTRGALITCEYNSKLWSASSEPGSLS